MSFVTDDLSVCGAAWMEYWFFLMVKDWLVSLFSVVLCMLDVCVCVCAECVCPNNDNSFFYGTTGLKGIVEAKIGV